MRLSVVTLVACLFALPAQAKYSGGTGEPNDPYQIATAADLIALGETPKDYDKHFVLTADIDLDPNLPGRKVFTEAVVAPRYSTPFAGVFDGNDHVISHLTITGETYQSPIGFFGGLSSSAEVKNVGMVDMSVVVPSSVNGLGGLVGRSSGGTISACYSEGSVSSSEYGQCVGGLVGDNHGMISACYSTASVRGGINAVGGLVGANDGMIWACHSQGPVSGGQEVGGLVGYNGSGTISACYSTGSVNGASGCGGLVGDIGNGVILACYSVGSVSGIDGVGGLVGANDSATISACFSTSSVTGMDATSRTSNWVAVGGLVGSNGGMISACYSTGAVKPHPSSRGGGGLVGREYDSGTVLACFWDVETSGQVAGADGIGLPTTQMQTAKSFLDAGWDFLGERANGLCDYWQMPPAGGYPVLTIFNGYAPPVLQGAGTSDDPYLLETADDFGAVWCEPKAHYQLVADASLSGITWAMAVIPAFGGSLDGQGHRITGMKITGGGRVGLIGFLSSGGVIKNLGVEDVNNVGTGDHVGALVGYNDNGTISACWSTGSVSSTYDVFNNVGTGDYVGGLVGYNDNGTISACWSTGSVSSAYDVFGGLVGMNWQGTISACHSTCTVSGKGGFTVTYAHAGGLVGANWFGTISACCSTGSVSGFNDVGGLVGENYDGTISACYSTGSVGGGKYGGLGLRVGGLVGTNSLSAWWAHSTISACYSTASVNGGDRVGGLVGENRSGTISACYSAGSVSGGRCVGGLVGQNDDSIAASFWDTLTSGQPNMCGEQMEQATGCDNSCGKTTAEMQTAGTFLEAGWDFVGETANGTQDSWWINEGKDYPRLWWEATATAED